MLTFTTAPVPVVCPMVAVTPVVVAPVPPANTLTDAIPPKPSVVTMAFAPVSPALDVVPKLIVAAPVVYPDPRLVTSTLSTLPLTPTVKAAPDPIPPENAIVGVEVYPDPGSVSVREMTRPLKTCASAAAPDPPPPVNDTVGGAKYPAPSLTICTPTTWDCVTELVVMVAPTWGLLSPMGCEVVAAPSQRKPLPMPSTPYRSLYRPLNRLIGRSVPV